MMLPVPWTALSQRAWGALEDWEQVGTESTRTQTLGAGSRWEMLQPVPLKPSSHSPFGSKKASLLNWLALFAPAILALSGRPQLGPPSGSCTAPSICIEEALLFPLHHTDQKTNV